MAITGTLITELDTFTGNPSSSTYLPIDNGSATYKIDARTLAGAVEIYIASMTELPQTVSNSKITANMKVLQSVLSNPSAQVDDWTVTTSAGSLTITGTISGTCSITMYLSEPR